MPPIVSTITRTAFRAGSQAASLGFSAAKFAAGRVRGVVGGGSSDDDTRYAPNPPVAQPETELNSVGDKPSARPLEAVEQPQKADASPAKAPKPTAAPVPRRTSNPKQARKVRARTAKGASASSIKAAEVEARGAKSRGGRPGTTDAENTPSERAAAGGGRQAAPMGAEDRADQG